MMYQLSRQVHYKFSGKMKIIKIITAGFLIFTLFTLAHLDAETSEKLLNIKDILSRVGERFNVYFTVEGVLPTEMYRELMIDDTIDQAGVKDLDDFIAKLTNHYPGLKIMQDKDNRQVYHIIDAKLYNLVSYKLNDVLNHYEYKGFVDDMIIDMDQKKNQLKMKNFFMFGERFSFSFFDVNISAKNSTIRSILTNCLELKKFDHVPWVCYTHLSSMVSVISYRMLPRVPAPASAP